MDSGDYKYWGFISYSHQDRRWGEWLQRALERYRVPASLRGASGEHGPVPPRLFPMFRDRDELPTAGGLDTALAQALEQSRCFVLVCSPAAAASRWVNEEVLRFKKLGREARILCLIVDGEPNATALGHPERECFPPALRFRLGADGQLSDVPAEPLAADLRASGDGRDHARLKIIAGLLGVGFDSLRRRDLQARNRRLAVVAGVATGVAALTIVLAVQAMVARRAAERSRQQGEDLIGFMLGDLRGKLEPLGKLEILDAVGDHAMAYFDQLDNRNLSEAALTARAKALRQIGDVRVNQGRAADAVEAFDAALTLNRRLADRHPQNSDLLFELGQSEYWVGYAAWRANQLDRAEEHWLAYQQVSRQLVARDAANAKWQLELAYTSNNLGSLAFARNQFDAALGHFRQAAEVAGRIAPQTAETQNTVANALSWQGSALQSLARLPEAIEALDRQAALFRDLSAGHPDDMPQQFKLTRSLAALGFALISRGDSARALLVADEGRIVADMLIGNDAGNRTYQSGLVAHVYIAAAALVLQGRWPEAQAVIDRAEGLLDVLRAKDANAFEYRRLAIRNRELAFDVALAQNRYTSAEAIAAAALAAAPCGDSEEERSEAARLECARAHLLALETGKPGPEAAAHRRAIDAALGSIDAAGDQSSLASLKAREQILLGEADSAVAVIVTLLLGQHYRPPDLMLFLQRNCAPVLRRALEASCMIAAS